MSKLNPATICPRNPTFLSKLPLLPPVVFAIIMGTGTLACTTLGQSEAFPILKQLAYAISWLNIILFICLAPYAFLNWMTHKTELAKQCSLPSQEAFLSTIGIGLLVLANQCLFFDWGIGWTFLFWLAGAFVTFFLNLAIIFKVFIGEHELGHITPVFFIPVVGLVVIPVAGSTLATRMPHSFGALILIVCLIALGAGLLLYSGLFAAMLQRHLLLKPIPDYLTPTLWIHLAPLGWGAISMLFMGGVLTEQPCLQLIEFFALLAWGAAAWWVLMAALLTIRALIHRGLHFSLAWWSFIFPLGSFTMLSKMLKIEYSVPISFSVWLLMLVIWITAAIKTLALAWRGCQNCTING